MAVIEVKADVAGIVWKIAAGAGQEVGEDDAVIILESMKMEIPIMPPKPGKVLEILVSERDPVAEGDVVARIEG